MHTLETNQEAAAGALRTDSITVAAVVVTFNREAWLIDCLNGLLSQTRPLERIYIIDNASTDGTKERLQQAGFLDNPVFRYVRLSSNLGGSGGFAAGLKIAYEDGFDWFWLMDDDVEPSPTGIADLLAFRDLSGCIHGRRTNPDGSPIEWGGQLFEKSVLIKRMSGAFPFDKSDVQKINTGCFEGMLISREVVTKIGLPNAAFFITWDDTCYGFLASRVTTVLYVNRLVLKRKHDIHSVDSQIFGQRVLLSPLALFYFHRNRFLAAKQLRLFSHQFWQATVWVVLRGIFREIVLTRSISRAWTIVRGTSSGIAWSIRTTRTRSVKTVDQSISRAGVPARL